MKSISVLLQYMQIGREYREEFNNEIKELAIKRLRILNSAMVVLSFYLIYYDMVILKQIDSILYRQGLLNVHIAILVIALTYLTIIHLLTKYKLDNVFNVQVLLYTYHFLALIVGISVTIVSFHLTLTIITYVTIMMCIVAFLPVSFLPAATINTLIQLSFVLFVSSYHADLTEIVRMKINSSVAFFVTMVILFGFHMNRIKDFALRQEMIKSNDNLIRLFEINPFPLFVLDLESLKVLRMNSKGKDYFFDNQEPDDASAFFLNLTSSHDFEVLLGLIKEEGSVTDHLTQVLSNTGSSWYLVNGELISYASKEAALIGITDITKLKTMENDLAKKASIDILTGIYNRSKGLELLGEFLSKEERFYLTFCDINSLKIINDEYGHIEGDKVIKIIADEIVSGINIQDLAFRYGGDEFILALKENTPDDHLIKLKHIEHMLSKKRDELDTPYPISLSYGVVYVDKPRSTNIQDLIELADNKMYHNKRQYYKINDSLLKDLNLGD